MDVEYYGPNPVVQGCYLAALGAAARMAAAVGDDEFAVTCRKLLAAGTDATEARLDNGAYYQQQVIPPGDFGQMAPRLRHPALGAERPDRPEFQIGDGCGIDQLVGEVCARVAGLGPLFDPGHARTALRSIGRLNYVADFGDWANYVRSYAVHGSGATLCSVTRAAPAVWFWSNGTARGTVRQSLRPSDTRAVQLEVLYGSLRLARVMIGGEEFRPPSPGVLTAGTAVSW